MRLEGGCKELVRVLSVSLNFPDCISQLQVCIKMLWRGLLFTTIYSRCPLESSMWEPTGTLEVTEFNTAIVQIKKSDTGEKTCPRSHNSLLTAYGLEPRVLSSKVFISCTLYCPYFLSIHSFMRQKISQVINMFQALY